ncbi:MAG: hypothetical protein HYV27_21140 [Candidatus Hydrogenedentes bacterium]|nr:hypothetical protein [Candidatus Hydrogenedentota bacterium]
MKSVILACALCIGAAGCAPDKPVNPPMNPTLSTVFEKHPNEQSLTIGDVEAVISLTAKLMERSLAPNVTVEEMATSSKALVLTTIDIKPPFPTELWVNFDIKSTKAFAETPVAVQGKIVREDQPIETIYTVLGEHARRADRKPIEGVPPQNFEVDVLKGLQSIPDSMLIQGELQLLLTPGGTKASEIDPASVTVPPERTGSCIGNALRINFHHEAGGA